MHNWLIRHTQDWNNKSENWKRCVSGRGTLGKRRRLQKEETDLQCDDFRGCNMEREEPHDMLASSRSRISGLCSVGLGGISGRLGLYWLRPFLFFLSSEIVNNVKILLEATIVFFCSFLMWRSLYSSYITFFLSSRT